MNKKLYTTDAYGKTADSGRPELDSENILNGGRAQKAYEKFFAGYTEYSKLTVGGKRAKTIREYTGEIYRQDLTEKQGVMVRIRFVLGCIAAIAMFTMAIVLPVASNNGWYTTLFGLMPAVFLAKLLLAAGTYSLSSRDMKIREYREVVLTMKKTTLHLWFSIAIAFVSTIYMFVTEKGSYSYLEVVRFLFLVAPGVIVQLLSYAESRIPYTVIPGKESA